MDQQRNLTDADIDAIIEAWENRFFTNLGKSIWSKVWMVLVGVIAGIAGYNIWHK